MPHVIVKLLPGRSEQEKTRLAEEIKKDVMDVLNYGEESVSVAIEEIERQDWAEKVYTPESLTVRRSSRRNLDTQCDTKSRGELTMITWSKDELRRIAEADDLEGV
jgi:4-oxalocrotonate tautomerase